MATGAFRQSPREQRLQRLRDRNRQVTTKPVGTAKPVAKPVANQWKVGRTGDEVSQQLLDAQAKLKASQLKKDRNSARIWQGRINELNTAQQRLGQNLPSAQQTGQSTMDMGWDLTGNAQNWIAQQGQFTPGDYEAMRQKAADSVYGSFEKRNEPLFKQQQEQLQTEMMNRGISQDNPMFAERMRQLQESQNDARLQAQNQAFLTGQGEQAQGFSQGLQTWQQPYAALGQVSQLPMAQQGFQWQMGEAEKNREFEKWRTQQELANRLQVAKTGGSRGGGGGGLSYEQQLELERQKYIMQITGRIPLQQPNPWNAAIGGVGAGISGAIVNSMNNPGAVGSKQG